MYFLPICPQLFAADGVTAGPGRGSALALSRETDWLVLDLFFFNFLWLVHRKYEGHVEV